MSSCVATKQTTTHATVAASVPSVLIPALLLFVSGGAAVGYVAVCAGTIVKIIEGCGHTHNRHLTDARHGAKLKQHQSAPER